MSGAGAYGAGLGPAGFDPVTEPSAPRNVEPPRALLFQLNGFDFPLDDDGLYKSVHPLDQWVAIQAGVTLGSIGTSAGTGNKLRRITHVGAPSTQREVEDALRTALATKVNAGAMRIEAIAYEAKPFGGFKVELRYQNLLLQAETARTLNLVR